MDKSFKDITKKLQDIKTYLCKIGPKRRQGAILNKKIDEANIIYSEFDKLINDVSVLISQKSLNKNEIEDIHIESSKIITLYSEIKSYCKLSTMDSFDLKTALSLFPVMTDDENCIKQLIDNIDYYGSLLEKRECKMNLINFILKSRLSQSAKLKLDSSYTSIQDLVKDMRSCLLTKKAATAIQSKLLQIRQENKSITDYGKEISELLVDLTISQADGNSANYAILKPINEKMALKRFSDGLRNRRLSTIIAARNYDSLKDAIQGALDEEASSQPTSGDIMSLQHRPNYFRGFRGRQFRGHRGRGNFHRGQSRPYNDANGNNYQRATFEQNRPGGPSWQRPGRSQHYSNRGKPNFNNHGNRNQYQQVNVAEEEENSTNENQFFRD
ncbi:hypothetical protein JYU34_011273 [Plutella xylostella]|uniref:Uncharacterized protein n=1 Tax=Plutella xylostella TaxID=51655 RepID=A0ABQ7QGI4_PLUXY|nr:hypothetical protein JYU34_011273 [Plutella xylostella]